MKRLACQIAFYTSLFLIIFSCEDATEADLYPKLSPANDYALTNPSPSSDQKIWFTFNKAQLRDGKYRVGINPSTGSKLFITLKSNEVVQAHIQTKNGFTTVLDPVPGGTQGMGHLAFNCEDPDLVEVFVSRASTNTSVKSPKYTVYVVPQGCDPNSRVIYISMNKNY
jgi:hypothetical protein